MTLRSAKITKLSEDNKSNSVRRVAVLPCGDELRALTDPNSGIVRLDRDPIWRAFATETYDELVGDGGLLEAGDHPNHETKDDAETSTLLARLLPSAELFASVFGVPSTEPSAGNASSSAASPEAAGLAAESPPNQVLNTPAPHAVAEAAPTESPPAPRDDATAEEHSPQPAATSSAPTTDYDTYDGIARVVSMDVEDGDGAAVATGPHNQQQQQQQTPPRPPPSPPPQQHDQQQQQQQQQQDAAGLGSSTTTSTTDSHHEVEQRRRIQASVRSLIALRLQPPMLMSYISGEKYPLQDFERCLAYDKVRFRELHPNVDEAKLLGFDDSPPRMSADRAAMLEAAKRYNTAALKVFMARQRAFARGTATINGGGGGGHNTVRFDS